MLQILNKRASTHPSHCEDSYFVYENESLVVGAVLDGCSTGYNSHWASQFIAYSLDKICRDSNGFEYFLHPLSMWDDFILNLFGQISGDIRVAQRLFDLPDMNFLSTVVFFVHRKANRELYVKFVGDGCVIVNGERMDVDEGNMPNYLAYHVNDRDDVFVEFIRSRPVKIFGEVLDFSICSDGVDSFHNLKFPHLDRNIAVSFLTSDLRSIKLKNGLNKKFNILTNRSDDLKLDDDHYWWDIQDDLTIIRYVADI